MKSLLKFFLLTWLLCAFPAWSGQSAFDVAHGTGKGDKLQIDTWVSDKSPTPEGPLQKPPNDARWQQRELGIRTIGFEYNGVWARTSLQNTSDKPVWGWLVVAEPYIDYVDCFFESDYNEAMVYRLGDKRPFDARPVGYPSHIIPINLFPHGTVNVACLLRNNGATTATFQYWAPEVYAVSERQLAFSRALCYGALSFTIIVAVLLAVINRNPLSFLLVAELLPVLVSTATREGDAFQLLWPGHPEFNVPPYMWMLTGMVSRLCLSNRQYNQNGFEQAIRSILCLKKPKFRWPKICRE